MKKIITKIIYKGHKSGRYMPVLKKQTGVEHKEGAIWERINKY